MNHVWWCFLFFARACVRAAALMLNVCLHPAAHCSTISYFLDQPKEERSFDTDSPRLLFLFSKLSVCGQCCCFFFFLSCCVLCASFMLQCCFQNYWHHSETGWQKWRAGYRGAKCALACEMEGWVVGNGGCHEGIGRRRQRNTEGQGGNGGGVQSQAYRVAAKPTVMLATGIGCCGPQVVLVCTSKGQAVNMKTQLIFPPSIQSFAPSTRLFSLALRLSFSLHPMRGTSKVLLNL